MQAKDFILSNFQGGGLRVQLTENLELRIDAVTMYAFLGSRSQGPDDVSRAAHEAGLMQRTSPWLHLQDIRAWTRKLNDFDDLVAELERLEPLIVKVGKRLPDGLELRVIGDLLAPYCPQTQLYGLSLLWRGAILRYSDDPKVIKRSPKPFLQSKCLRGLALASHIQVQETPGNMVPLIIALAFCEWVSPQAHLAILRRLA